jgi:hypothetical protein
VIYISNIISIKETIYGILSDICTTYSERINDQSIFPYATYNITATKIDSEYIYIVTIDVWGNNNDTTDIENISSDIIDNLDYKLTDNTDLTCHSYLDYYGEVDVKEENIFRRQIRFIIKTYFK